MPSADAFQISQMLQTLRPALIHRTARPEANGMASEPVGGASNGIFVPYNLPFAESSVSKLGPGNTIAEIINSQGGMLTPLT